MKHMKKYILPLLLLTTTAWLWTGCNTTRADGDTPAGDTDTPTVNATVTEAETDAVTEADTLTETDATTNTEAETETKTETETEIETETETDTEPLLRTDRLNAWYEYPTTKIDQRAPLSIQHSGMTDYTVSLARNETENAHLLLYAPVAVNDVSVEISDVTDENGNTVDATLLIQYYVKRPVGGTLPDPLAPTNDQTRVFDLAKRYCRSIFVQIRTTADSVAGDYTATVTVKVGGEVYETLPLYVHVWDFVLPEATSTVTSVGLYADQLTAYYPEADPTELYKQHYDFLLDNKILAMDLPYSVLDDRADAYMNDPRVTAFRVWPDANMPAVYAKLKTNPVWLEKAYFYCVDEVYTVEQLENLSALYGQLKEAYPEIRRVSPFYTIFDPDTGDEIDGFDVMAEVIDIWCPLHGPAFTPWVTDGSGEDWWWYMYKDPHGNRTYNMATYIQKHGDFRARLEAEIAGGDDLWWYVCNAPNPFYTNLYIEQSGVTNRALFWQQKLYNVTGFLYWTSNWWSTATNRGVSPWKFPQFENNNHNAYGDGVLIYPGKDVGHNSPCSSLRLESFRDGLEDYDYLVMYEEQYGTEAMNEILTRVAQSITSYTDDSAVLNAARTDLGNAIEAAMKQAAEVNP